MTIAQIAKILELHSVPHYIEGDRIYADSMIAFTGMFEIVEDLTDRTRSELFAWLGY